MKTVKVGKNHSRILTGLLPAAVFLCTLWVFADALDNDFVTWDDPQYVYNNRMIQSLAPDKIKGMFTDFHSSGNWHPLTLLSHAVDYRLFQLDPWGHHLTSILIHGLNTCLVSFLFVVLVRKARPDFGSGSALWVAGAIVGLLFGIHPLRVESVAWVSERKDLLCGFFVVSTLLVYLFYVSAKTKRSRIFLYSASLTLFILALLSKPMAVTVPVIFLLLDVYPLMRIKEAKQLWNRILEKLPFFALSLLAGMIALVGQRSTGAISSIQQIDLEGRVVNAVISLVFYLEKTFWPTDLVPFYPVAERLTWANGLFIGSVFVLVAITLCCGWGWRKRQRFWMIAWFYYLVTLSPVVGIIQVVIGISFIRIDLQRLFKFRLCFIQ